jgi:hypothetical protein
MLLEVTVEELPSLVETPHEVQVDGPPEFPGPMVHVRIEGERLFKVINRICPAPRAVVCPPQLSMSACVRPRLRWEERFKLFQMSPPGGDRFVTSIQVRQRTRLDAP